MSDDKVRAAAEVGGVDVALTVADLTALGAAIDRAGGTFGFSGYGVRRAAALIERQAARLRENDDWQDAAMDRLKELAAIRALAEDMPAARACVKARPNNAALLLLRTLEFDARGYCHVCGGWEQIKGQGCTTRRHTPDCAWVAATKENAK